MNREEIVREADSWLRMNGIGSDRQTCFMMALFAQHVSALVAAHEREACAKVCDGWTHANGDDCAAAIRARGEVPR